MVLLKSKVSVQPLPLIQEMGLLVTYERGTGKSITSLNAITVGSINVNWSDWSWCFLLKYAVGIVIDS